MVGIHGDPVFFFPFLFHLVQSATRRCHYAANLCKREQIMKSAQMSMQERKQKQRGVMWCLLPAVKLIRRRNRRNEATINHADQDMAC